MVKKIIALLMAMCMIFAFCACAEKASQQDTEKSANEAAVDEQDEDATAMEIGDLKWTVSGKWTASEDGEEPGEGIAEEISMEAEDSKWLTADKYEQQMEDMDTEGWIGNLKSKEGWTFIENGETELNMEGFSAVRTFLSQFETQYGDAYVMQMFIIYHHDAYLICVYDLSEDSVRDMSDQVLTTLSYK